MVFMKAKIEKVIVVCYSVVGKGIGEGACCVYRSLTSYSTINQVSLNHACFFPYGITFKN